MSSFLQQFAHGFAALNKDNLHLLGELYSDDVHFSDPLHEVHGLAQMQHYFSQLYSHVSDLTFDIHGLDEVRPGAGYLRWTLHYRHPRLAGGQPLQVQGCSYLQWHDKVYRHRDYFDAGALLYEHLPLMGRLIGWLKRRLA